MHRFSAASLCPRVNAIQHRREWSRSHSQEVKLWLEESEKKNNKERAKNERKGEKGDRDVSIAMQVALRIKKIHKPGSNICRKLKNSMMNLTNPIINSA